MKFLLLATFLLASLSSAQDDTVRIMPLGDSITELDWQGGYRGFLYKLLSDQGFGFDFVGTKTTNHDDDNLGFTFPAAYWNHEGYNSATITDKTGSAWEWNQHVDEKLAANPPDVALVLLGTNDLNNGCCSAADIADDMSALLDQVWAFDSTIVVILGTPPSVDPSRYATLDSRISAFGALLPALVAGKEALGRSIALADHRAAMNATTDLVGDGIHPSPGGYEKMARVWYEALTATITLPSDAADAPVRLPTAFSLHQNYPNPFNPSTTLGYSLPARTRVTIRIHDVLGRTVATLVDEMQSPGTKEVRWDAADRPGGVYYCRITAGSFSATRGMLLVR